MDTAVTYVEAAAPVHSQEPDLDEDDDPGEGGIAPEPDTEALRETLARTMREMQQRIERADAIRWPGPVEG